MGLCTEARTLDFLEEVMEGLVEARNLREYQVVNYDFV